VLHFILESAQQDFLPAAEQFGIEVIKPGELVRRERLLERLAE